MANYLALLLLEEEEVAAENNYLRQFQRNLRDISNPFEMPECRFVEVFRFPQRILIEIIEEVAPFMDQIRSHRIPKHLRILAAVAFFASGSYQRVIGNSAYLNVSQAQVSRAVTEVCDILCDHLGRRWVHFPEIENYPTIKERFMNQFNMPGVIGCIDATHVAIVTPGPNVQHAYYNRKGYHSKNVLIVCDIDYKILAINARFAGASHDSFVWQGSNIREELNRRFIRGNRTSWLLGDSGYPLEPFLMTPVRNPPPESPECRYNIAHSRARSCVERCIGILKTRFRCLLKERVLHYDPAKAGSIITACSILHNIMMRHRLPLPEEEEEEEEDEEEIIIIANNNDNGGNIIRQNIIHNNFN